MNWNNSIPEPPSYGFGPPMFGSDETQALHDGACIRRRYNMRAHKWEVAPQCAVVTPSGDRLGPGAIVRLDHFVHTSEKRAPLGIVEKLVQLGVVLESMVFADYEPPRAA